MPLKQQENSVNLSRWLLGGGLLLGFMLLTSVFVLLERQAEDAAGGCQLNKVKHAALSAFPGVDTDEESAVRWDSRCRSNNLARLENRFNQRLLSAPQSILDKSDFIITAAGSVALPKRPFGYNEINFFYYRRLWQKVLPGRAGPDGKC